MKEILIIDYNINNTGSVVNAIKHLGYKPVVSDRSVDILKFKKIILPGVGAFKSAMKMIKKKKIDINIKKAIEKNSKILGICLGMQLLCKSSEEFGYTKGIGLIDTDIISWKKSKNKFYNIHIGFNSVIFNKNMKLFKGIKNRSDFYFVHSFYAKPIKKLIGLCGNSNFNNNFISAYEHKNVFATQFHPEKSHENGLIILKNFCEL